MTPGEHVAVLADALGVGHTTVVQHDRLLKEAGLRSMSGRGTSAARITTRDAANLAITVVASLAPKDTLKTAERYLKLNNVPLRGIGGDLATSEERGAPPSVIEWCLSGFPMPSLQELQARHTLSDAVAALFEAACDGTMESAAQNLPVVTSGNVVVPQNWRIDVDIFGPLPRARVRVWTPRWWEQHEYSPSVEQAVGADEIAEVVNRYIGDGDLRQSRSFGHRTLLAVGTALRDGRA